MQQDSTVENHTLALLREMRTENKAMFEGLNARIDKLDARIDGLEVRMNKNDALLGKVIDAVTAIAVTQEQHTAILEQHTTMLAKLHEGQQIIERDLTTAKMRVQRVEHHVGLLKA
jgi:peptidoglycan hydrolase CwlO-like protein